MCTTNRHRFSLFNYDSDHFRVGLGIVCCNNVLHNRAYFFVTVDEARKITSLPFTQTIILIESVFVYHIIPDPVRNNSGPIQDHFLTILHQPIEFLTIIPQPVTPSAPPLPEILTPTWIFKSDAMRPFCYLYSDGVLHPYLSFRSTIAL